MLPSSELARRVPETHKLGATAGLRKQVERFGGAHGVLDHNVVLSALARPRQRWSCDESADLADLAAGYLVGFARPQGFRDGNKRTGLACALVFLALNDASLYVAGAELYEITMAVATNQAGDPEVAAVSGLRGCRRWSDQRALSNRVSARSSAEANACFALAS